MWPMQPRSEIVESRQKTPHKKMPPYLAERSCLRHACLMWRKSYPLVALPLSELTYSCKAHPCRIAWIRSEVPSHDSIVRRRIACISCQQKDEYGPSHDRNPDLVTLPAISAFFSGLVQLYDVCVVVSLSYGAHQEMV